MKREGTYEEYRTQLSARRRPQTAAKRQAMGKKRTKPINTNAMSKDMAFHDEVEPHLAQSFPLPWLPLEWMEEEEGEGRMAASLPHAIERDWFERIVDEL